MATDDFSTTIQNMKDSNTITDFDAIHHKFVELTPEYKANLAKLKSAAKQVADTNYQQFKAALDTYKAPYSNKVTQADEKYKTQLEELKEAYRSQTKDKSDESVAKARIDDVRRQVDEDYQKYGGSLAVDAKTEMYADHPAALKFRNDPLYKDLYLRKITEDNAYYNDIAQKGSEIKTMGAIDSSKLTTGNFIKQQAKSIGSSLVNALYDAAAIAPNAYLNAQRYSLLNDGTVDKRKDIEYKKQQRDQLLSLSEDAKNRGDITLSDEYLKAANAPELQNTPEDEEFLKSDRNQELNEVNRLSEQYSKDKDYITNLSDNVFEKRMEYLAQNGITRDLDSHSKPSTAGDDIVRPIWEQAKIRSKNLSGLAAEIARSLPIMLMSTSGFGMLTGISGQASDMINSFWQENQANPDPSTRMSSSEFIQAGLTSTAAAFFNLLGDRAVANGINLGSLFKGGAKALSPQAMQKRFLEIQSDVVRDFPGLGTVAHTKIAMQRLQIELAADTKSIAEALKNNPTVKEFNEAVAEGTAGMNSNILSGLAGDAVSLAGTASRGYKGLVSTLRNKVSGITNGLLGPRNPVSNVTNKLAEIGEVSAKGASEGIENLQRMFPRLGNKLGTAGSWVKNQVNSGINLGFDNAMNEFLSGEAAYQATGDESRRATTESIAGAFGSGLLQAPMMGAHGMAAGLAGHYGKKFIEGKKDRTSSKVFNTTYENFNKLIESPDTAFTASSGINEYITDHKKEIDDVSNKINKVNDELAEGLEKINHNMGELQTKTIDNGIQIIDLDAAETKALMNDSNANNLIMKAYNQQQPLVQKLGSLQEQVNKLNQLHTKAMDNVVEAIRGNKTSDKVKDLDIKAIDSIVNEYDASDAEGKSKLKTDFINSYSNSVAKSKDVSKEDAESLAQQEFDNIFKSEAEIRNQVTAAVNSNQIPSTIKDSIESTAKDYFEGNQNDQSLWTKWISARTMSALASRGISQDVVNRLNKYDHAGDHLVTAIVEKTQGNFNKSKQAFDEFTKAMKAAGKETELEYQTQQFDSLDNTDYTKYEGYKDMLMNLKESSVNFGKKAKDWIKDTFTSENTNEAKGDNLTNENTTGRIASAWEKATETRGGGEALRAAIKRVDPDAEMLDTDEYVALRKKVKKDPKNASNQDKINLFVNAIARRDGEGVDIYRNIESENQSLNEDEKKKANIRFFQTFESAAAKMEADIDEINSSMATLSYLTNGSVSKVTATGSKGKADLEQILKDNKLNTAFSVICVNPDAVEDSRDYIIVSTTYKVFAPLLTLTNFATYWQARRGKLSSAAVMQKIADVLNYYKEHEEELKHSHILDAKINDFDFIIHKILFSENGFFNTASLKSELDLIKSKYGNDTSKMLEIFRDALLMQQPGWQDYNEQLGISGNQKKAATLIANTIHINPVDRLDLITFSGTVMASPEKFSSELKDPKSNIHNNINAYKALIYHAIRFNLNTHDFNRQQINNQLLTSFDNFTKIYVNGKQSLDKALQIGKARNDASSATSLRKQVLGVAKASQLTARTRARQILGRLNHYAALRVSREEKARKALEKANKNAKQNILNHTGTEEEIYRETLEEFKKKSPEEQEKIQESARNVYNGLLGGAVTLTQALANAKIHKIEDLKKINITVSQFRILQLQTQKVMASINRRNQVIEDILINDFARKDVVSLESVLPIYQAVYAYYSLHSDQVVADDVSLDQDSNNFSRLAFGHINADDKLTINHGNRYTYPEIITQAFSLDSDITIGESEPINVSDLIETCKKYSKENTVVVLNRDRGDSNIILGKHNDLVAANLINKQIIFTTNEEAIISVLSSIDPVIAKNLFGSIFTEESNKGKYGLENYSSFDDFWKAFFPKDTDVTDSDIQNNRRDFIIQNMDTIFGALSESDQIDNNSVSTQYWDEFCHKVFGDTVSIKNIAEDIAKGNFSKFAQHSELLSLFAKCKFVQSELNKINENHRNQIRTYIAVETRKSNELAILNSRIAQLKNNEDITSNTSIPSSALTVDDSYLSKNWKDRKQIIKEALIDQGISEEDIKDYKNIVFTYLDALIVRDKLKSIALDEESLKDIKDSHQSNAVKLYESNVIDTCNHIRSHNYFNKWGLINTNTELAKYKTQHDALDYLRQLFEDRKNNFDYYLSKLNEAKREAAQKEYDTLTKKLVNYIKAKYPNINEDLIRLIEHPEEFNENTIQNILSKNAEYKAAVVAIFDSINKFNIELATNNKEAWKFINTESINIPSVEQKNRDADADIAWDQSKQGEDSINDSIHNFTARQLMIDHDKISGVFRHCNSIDDVIDALAATNTEWSDDFINLIKMLVPYMMDMSNIASLQYINSRYGSTDIYDQLTQEYEGNKYGNAMINLAATIALAHTIYSGGKLEAMQNKDKLDRIPNLTASARAALSSLQGANRDDIIEKVIKDLQRILPFRKNSYQTKLAEGAAIRAFQAFEKAGLIKQQFVNLATGEVHSSSTDMSNQGCITIVSKGDNEQLYQTNKDLIARIDKYSQKDDIDINEKLFGVKAPSMLEPENEKAHEKTIKRLDTDAYKEFYKIARAVSDTGSLDTNSVNLTEDFNEFIEENKNNPEYVYILNAILNAIRSGKYKTIQEVLKALKEGSVDLSKSNINYFKQDTSFKFNQQTFNDYLKNTPVIFAGKTTTEKAKVAIVNMDYIDPMAAAIEETGETRNTQGFVLLDGEQVYSDPKTRTLAPIANIQGIATLDSTPVAFQVSSGLSLLRDFMLASSDPAEMLDRIMNDDVKGILDELINCKPGDRWYNVKVALGLKDIALTGEYAKAIYNDNKSTLENALIQLRFTLGRNIFQGTNFKEIKGYKNIHNLYDYLVSVDTNRITDNEQDKDIQSRFNNLYELYNNQSDADFTFELTRNDGKKIKFTAWDKVYFYHRNTINNRIYTCGSIITNREQKGNRCIFKSLFRDDKGNLVIASELFGDSLAEMFADETKVYGWMSVMAANLGLSPDKVYRMNYWRNEGKDGKDYSLAGSLITLFEDPDFENFIKHVSDYFDGKEDTLIPTDSDGKFALDEQYFKNKCRVATMDASQADSNIPTKGYGILGGDWTSNSNSIPILRELVAAYKRNPKIFKKYAQILRVYRDQNLAQLQQDNVSPDAYNSTRVKLDANRIAEVQKVIDDQTNGTFDHIYFRMVHEGDGLTSGPGISNGLFDYLTAYEMLETTDAADPRYKIFNMTGTFMFDNFDQLRSDVNYRHAFGNRDANLDLYLSLGDRGTYLFHYYLRAAMENLVRSDNPDSEKNFKRIIALLSLFGEKKSEVEKLNKLEAADRLAKLIYSRDNSKHLMTPYNYGAGLKALSGKVVEVAFELLNKEIESADLSTYTFNTFVTTGLDLSENNTFAFEIDPSDAIYNPDQTIKVVAKRTGSQITYSGVDAQNHPISSEVLANLCQKAWSKRKVTTDFRHNQQENTGIYEFIRGSVGSSMAKIADRVMGKSREDSKYIGQTAGLLSAMAENMMVTSIYEVVREKKGYAEGNLDILTNEDIDAITRRVEDKLNMTFADGNGSFQAGSIKSALLVKMIPAIHAIIQDINESRNTTYYPVDNTNPENEKTKGLSYSSQGSTIKSGSSAAPPIHNHTLDARIANYTHVYAKTAFIDVFDAMILGAGSFANTLGIANTAHMEVMFLQNARLELAKNLDNAIQAYNAEVMSPYAKDKDQHFQDLLQQTFTDYGVSNMTSIEDLEAFRDKLAADGIEYDFNHIQILTAVRKGYIKHLKFNGYFGAAESTIDLAENLPLVDKMIQVLCARNHLKYDVSGTGTANDPVQITYSYENVKGNDTDTGLNYAIFNRLKNKYSQNPLAKEMINAIATSQDTKTVKVKLETPLRANGLFDRNASVAELWNYLSSYIGQNKKTNNKKTNNKKLLARYKKLFDQVTQEVREHDDDFRGPLFDALRGAINAQEEAYNKLDDKTKQSDDISEAMRAELYKTTAHAFNTWDADINNKDNEHLWNAVSGYLQESFSIHMLAGSDLYNLTSEVFLDLYNSVNGKVSSITKAHIVNAVLHKLSGKSVTDNFNDIKLGYINAAITDSNASINEDVSKSAIEALEDLKTTNQSVYLIKSTDLPFSFLDILNKSSNDAYGLAKTPTEIIHKYIDKYIIDTYGKASGAIIIEGHNTTDFLMYQRIMALKGTELTGITDVIYIPETPIVHGETGSLRTLDTLIADKLTVSDSKCSLHVNVFAPLSDSVDQNLIDSIDFWGKPGITNTSTYNSDTFAIPTQDATGHILDIAFADKSESRPAGAELKRSISSRNKINPNDIYKINLNEQYNLLEENVEDEDIDTSIRVFGLTYRTDVNALHSRELSNKYDTIPNHMWLHATINTDLNIGFTHSNAESLIQRSRFTPGNGIADHNSNPKDFGNLGDHNVNSEVTIIPVFIVNGKAVLPEGEYFNAQLVKSLGEDILSRVSELYSRQARNDIKDDPFVAINYTNKTLNGIHKGKIYFMNLSAQNLTSRQEIMNYIRFNKHTGKYEWKYDQLLEDFSYIDTNSLPNPEMVAKGEGSVDMNGTPIDSADANGFYRFNVLKKGFNIFESSGKNAQGNARLSYSQYLIAHLTADFAGTAIDSTNHINLMSNSLGNLMNTNSNMSRGDHDIFRLVQQYTGRVDKKTAEHYNTRPLNTSGLGTQTVRNAVEEGRKLEGKTAYTRTQNYYNNKRSKSRYSNESKSGIPVQQIMDNLDTYQAKNGNQMFKEVMDDIQWDIDNGHVTEEEISYLKNIANLLRQTNMQMHFINMNNIKADDALSILDFNNPDNMERAAVVTANRSIMARAGVCRSEIIMHEISHNLFKLMTPHQLDEATRLWHLASKIITPEDLEKAGATHDEAQRIYDYVFSDTTADSVQEFLAYALTNRFMIKALNSKNNKINAEFKKAVANKTTGFINKAIYFFTHHAADEKNLAVNKVLGYFKSSIAITQDMQEARKNFIRNNSASRLRNEFAETINPELSNLKTSLLSKVDKQLTAIPSYEDVLDKVFHLISSKEDGLMHDLIEQAKGVTKDNLQYILCGYKYRNQLDSAKGVAIGSINDSVNELLNSYGITDTKTRQDLSTVILRYDLSALAQRYSSDDIVKFLDPKNTDRKVELANLKNKIKDPWMLARANDMVEYLKTGSNPGGLRYANAYQIAAKFGTSTPNTELATGDDLVSIIDNYVTLKALDDSINDNKSSIKDLYQKVVKAKTKEGNTGDELIKKLAGLELALRRSESSNVWDSHEMAIRNVPKSLLFPSSDSDKKVRLVALEDLSRWTAIGYNRIKDIPVENINGHKMVWINVAHHNYVPDTPGLFSKAARNFVHGKNNQLNIYGEDFMYGRLSPDDQAEMFQKVLNQINAGNGTVKIGTNKYTNYVPRFGANGQIIAIDVELNEQTKETYLNSGNYSDINMAMGNYAGMITERAKSDEINKKCAEALLKYYKENKTGKKFKFIKDESDPMYKFLPNTIKNMIQNDPELKNKGFPVETKYIDYVFGKERFSFANWAEKKAMQSASENFFIDTLGFILGHKWSLTIENFLQKLTQFNKNMIVVKMIKPSLINVYSNLSILHSLGGLTVKDAVRYMNDGRKAIEEYRYWLKQQQINNYDIMSLDKNDPQYQAKFNKLNAYREQIVRTIAANPAIDLFKAGLYNATARFTTDYQKPLSVRVAESIGISPVTSIVNDPRVKNVFSVKGSNLYNLSMEIATSNDFAARYALYKHMQDQAQKDGKELDMNEFIKKGDDLFINYNIPEPQLIDYLDRMGIFCFSRYFIGVPKIVWNGLKNHLVSMLGSLGYAGLLGAIIGGKLPTIFDSMISSDAIARRIKLPGDGAIDNLDNIPTISLVNMGLN